MSEDLRLPPTLDTWVDVAQDTRYVTALARGLKILACFDLHHPKLTHQQIHERTKLPKATISRLLFEPNRSGLLSAWTSHGQFV